MYENLYWFSFYAEVIVIEYQQYKMLASAGWTEFTSIQNNDEIGRQMIGF